MSLDLRFRVDTFLISGATLSTSTLFFKTHWRALIPLVNPVIRPLHFAAIFRLLMKVLNFVVFASVIRFAAHLHILQQPTASPQLDLACWINVSISGNFWNHYLDVPLGTVPKNPLNSTRPLSLLDSGNKSRNLQNTIKYLRMIKENI